MTDIGYSMLGIMCSVVALVLVIVWYKLGKRK